MRVSDAIDIWLALSNEWDPQSASDRFASLSLSQWVYLGEDSIWRVRAERTLLTGIPRMSITEQLDQISKDLRKPYIEWIGHLSVLNDSPEWWGSEIAAKNPYTNLFIRICFLKICKELIESPPEKKTLIVCSSKALLRELISMADNAGIRVSTISPALSQRLFRSLRSGVKRCTDSVFLGWSIDLTLFFIRKIKNAIFPGRQRYLSETLAQRGEWVRSKVFKVEPFSGEKTALILTWVDHRNFTAQDGFEDPHLGVLASHLKTLGFEVKYLVQVLPSASFTEVVGRLIDLSVPAYVPEFFADQKMIRKCRSRSRKFALVIPDRSEIEGVPVAGLAREHVDEYRAKLAETIFYEELINGLSRCGVSPDLIMHTCEGHSWEQILAWSTRKFMPGTKVAGFENGTLSRSVHSMYPATSEFGIRPLPDRILTYGKLARDILINEGWPKDMVVETGTVRHGHLLRKIPNNENFIGNERLIKVLIAPGIGINETVELLEKAILAFAHDPNYVLTVKCHPSLDESLAESVIRDIPGATNICWSNRLLSDLFHDSHVLLFSYTTACFEAIPFGLLPVFVRSENNLNLNKIAAFPSLYWEVNQTEDLQTTLHAIIHMSLGDYVAWHSNALAVIERVFTPISVAKIDTAICFDEFQIDSY